MANKEEAFEKLNSLLKNARLQHYRPIRLAEILYKARVNDVDFSGIENFRVDSRKWRDEVTQRLTGDVSTSSIDYQDRFFDHIPLPIIQKLHEINIERPGIVENYIYHYCKRDWGALFYLDSKLDKVEPEKFSMENFLRGFTSIEEVKRNIGKVYEIISYALLSTLVETLEAKISLSLENPNQELLEDFKDFTELFLGVKPSKTSFSTKATPYRFGRAYAADVGIDIQTNFGMAIQVKAVTLDEDIVEEAEDIPAGQVVIVGKEGDMGLIKNIVKKLGLSDKVRGFATINDLKRWSNLCFLKYSEEMGEILLNKLRQEITTEFRQINEMGDFLEERGYREGQLEGEFEISKQKAQTGISDWEEEPKSR